MHRTAGILLIATLLAACGGAVEEPPPPEQVPVREPAWPTICIQRPDLCR